MRLAPVGVVGVVGVGAGGVGGVGVGGVGGVGGVDGVGGVGGGDGNVCAVAELSCTTVNDLAARSDDCAGLGAVGRRATRVVVCGGVRWCAVVAAVVAVVAVVAVMRVIGVGVVVVCGPAARGTG